MASAMAFGWPFQRQSAGVDAAVSAPQSGSSPRRLKLLSPASRKAELLVTEEQISFEHAFVELESSLENLELTRHKEALVDEDADVASTSSNGSVASREESLEKTKRNKKPWSGPIRPRRNPPLPPWTEAQCREKQMQIVDQLISNELAENKLPASIILDGWLGKVTRVDLANVIKDLDSQHRYPVLLEVFYWMQRCQGRLNPKPHLCNMVLGILGRAGLVEDAEELFQWIKAKDWDKLRACNAMIGAYYQAGRHRDAWVVYQQMLVEGIDPDEVTYNILICKSGKYGYPVEKLFLEMKSSGMKITLRSYNAVLSAFTKEGDIVKVEEVIREMMLEHLRPDLISFNALIAAYAMARKPERGLQVLENMKAAGVLPDIVSYTTLIQMFSRSSMHKEAIQMFQEMVSNDCRPDRFVYSLLVSVYGKAGLVADALQVFRKLQLEGHRPTLVTYTSLISAYLHKDLFEESRQQFSQMEAFGVRADVHLLNTMMNGYAKAGLVTEAGNFLRKQMALGVLPNRTSYAIVVEGFLSLGRGEDAAAAYEVMSEAGFKDGALGSRLPMASR